MPNETSSSRVNTPQAKVWQGEFGRAYTDRNNFTVEQLEEFYQKTFSVKRSDVNGRMLEGVPRDARMLEVGCNVGNVLRCLQAMGFTNLYGIELQPYAVEAAKKQCENINIIQGSALDIPFKDGFFDVVYHAGVISHISPSDLPLVFSEVHRCSARWIWGCEAYAKEVTTINYRGHEELMWKADYAGMYQRQFPALKLLRSEMLQYVGTENFDRYFVFEKPRA